MWWAQRRHGDGEAACRGLRGALNVAGARSAEATGRNDLMAFLRQCVRRTREDRVYVKVVGCNC
jgi:hypothetical protein